MVEHIHRTAKELVEVLAEGDSNVSESEHGNDAWLDSSLRLGPGEDDRVGREVVAPYNHALVYCAGVSPVVPTEEAETCNSSSVESAAWT
jgi:hypothetical protein